MTPEISILKEYNDAINKSMDQTDALIDMVKEAIEAVKERDKIIAIQTEMILKYEKYFEEKLEEPI